MGTCDNCARKSTVRSVNVATHVKNLIDLVKACGDQNFTKNQCVDIYKGAKTAKMREENFDNLQWYALGSEFKKPELERIVNQMILKNIAKEVYLTNKSGFSCAYLRLGNDYRKYENGRTEVFIDFPVESANAGGSSTTNTKKRKSDVRDIPVEQEEYVIDDDIEFVDVESIEPQALLNYESPSKVSKSAGKSKNSFKKIQSPFGEASNQIPGRSNAHEPGLVMVTNIVGKPKKSKTPSKAVQTTFESAENVEIAKNNCFNELVALRNTVRMVSNCSLSPIADCPNRNSVSLMAKSAL